MSTPTEPLTRTTSASTSGMNSPTAAGGSGSSANLPPSPVRHSFNHDGATTPNVQESHSPNGRFDRERPPPVSTLSATAPGKLVQPNSARSGANGGTSMPGSAGGSANVSRGGSNVASPAASPAIGSFRGKRPGGTVQTVAIDSPHSTQPPTPSYGNSARNSVIGTAPALSATSPGSISMNKDSFATYGENSFVTPGVLTGIREPTQNRTDRFEKPPPISTEKAAPKPVTTAVAAAVLPELANEEVMLQNIINSGLFGGGDGPETPTPADEGPKNSYADGMYDGRTYVKSTKPIVSSWTRTTCVPHLIPNRLAGPTPANLTSPSRGPFNGPGAPAVNRQATIMPVGSTAAATKQAQDRYLTSTAQTLVLPVQGANGPASELRQVISGHSSGYLYFLRHLQREYASESLVFWRAVEDFIPLAAKEIQADQASNGTITPAQRTFSLIYLSLYSMYIRPGAKHEINISSSLRDLLRKDALAHDAVRGGVVDALNGDTSHHEQAAGMTIVQNPLQSIKNDKKTASKYRTSDSDREESKQQSTNSSGVPDSIEEEPFLTGPALAMSTYVHLLQSQTEIEKLLTQDCLPRFRHTAAYEKWKKSYEESQQILAAGDREISVSTTGRSSEKEITSVIGGATGVSAASGPAGSPPLSSLGENTSEVPPPPPSQNSTLNSSVGGLPALHRQHSAFASLVGNNNFALLLQQAEEAASNPPHSPASTNSNWDTDSRVPRGSISTPREDMSSEKRGSGIAISPSGGGLVKPTSLAASFSNRMGVGSLNFGAFAGGGAASSASSPASGASSPGFLGGAFGGAAFGGAAFGAAGGGGAASMAGGGAAMSGRSMTVGAAGFAHAAASAAIPSAEANRAMSLGTSTEHTYLNGQKRW